MKTKRSFIVSMMFGLALLAADLTLAQPDDERHGAGDHQIPAKQMDPAQALSPELRQLLVKEMRLIDDAMGKLLSAISAGDWETIDTIAGKIQHSFILKQKLTDHQLHELHEKLPGEFVQMDVRFHGTAGKLAAIARHRDAELATFYYSRLVEGCVSCHTAFAPQRFPGLAGDESEEHRH